MWLSEWRFAIMLLSPWTTSWSKASDSYQSDNARTHQSPAPLNPRKAPTWGLTPKYRLARCKEPFQTYQCAISPWNMQRPSAARALWNPSFAKKTSRVKYGSRTAVSLACTRSYDTAWYCSAITGNPEGPSGHWRRSEEKCLLSRLWQRAWYCSASVPLQTSRFASRFPNDHITQTWNKSEPWTAQTISHPPNNAEWYAKELQTATSPQKLSTNRATMLNFAKRQPHRINCVA